MEYCVCNTKKTVWHDLTEQKALFASAFWGSLHYILSHFPQNKSICVPISVPDDVSAHAYCTCSTKVTTFYSIIVLSCHGHLTGKLLLRMINKSSWKKEMAQDLSFTHSICLGSQFVSRCSCIAWSFQVYTGWCPCTHGYRVSEHLCIQLTYIGVCMYMLLLSTSILLLWLWAKTLFKPAEMCVWTIRPGSLLKP